MADCNNHRNSCRTDLNPNAKLQYDFIIQAIKLLDNGYIKLPTTAKRKIVPFSSFSLQRNKHKSMF